MQTQIDIWNVRFDLVWCIRNNVPATCSQVPYKVQSPSSPWKPIFGERFARDLMFMFLNQFFAVQSQSSFWLPANYEITPTEKRYQGDDELCIYTHLMRQLLV